MKGIVKSYVASNPRFAKIHQKIEKAKELRDKIKNIKNGGLKDLVKEYASKDPRFAKI